MYIVCGTKLRYRSASGLAQCPKQERSLGFFQSPYQLFPGALPAAQPLLKYLSHDGVWPVLLGLRNLLDFVAVIVVQKEYAKLVVVCGDTLNYIELSAVERKRCEGLRGGSRKTRSLAATCIYIDQENKWA